MRSRIPIADPGLQPERTVMAWGRTLISFLVVAAVLLRWLPHYGVGLGVVMLIAVLTAGGIYLSQQRRYSRMAHGVQRGKVGADAVAVLAMTCALVALGSFSLVLVLRS